ncbi:mucin-2 protein [Nocardioides aquiterrae]|uniref:ARB-07466-like C-terminal domain-containing protein n=1 Tax=Nocardioides aquiterrae TaxID=203799 RepID=A0ABN1UJ98_9ACTN
MAEHRHKRDTDARRKPRAALVAAPLALLATASAVTIGVLASSPEPTLLAQDTAADVSGATVARDTVSRSGSRLEAEKLRLKPSVLTQRAVAKADERRWTTTTLNLWSASGDDATQVGELEAGKRVLVTGRTAADRVEIVWQGEARWVTAGYLSEEKPEVVTAAGGLSMEPCPDPSVESGLTSNAVYVYRSVCHAFPQITSYGGWDAHGEHSSGRALDIMTTDKALGDQIAAFLQAHASELHLYDVIWWDLIWTPERASEGWRDYGDHGSATANHMDHVHVATY